MPLLHGDRVVLAGDHCQLPPTVISTEAAREGFDRSLLERLADSYGDRLVRVRHRYNEQSGRSFKTVELIVEETSWKPREPPNAERIVRLERQETRLPYAVKDASGWWNPQERVWELRQDRVASLGLEDRILEGRDR